MSTIDWQQGFSAAVSSTEQSTVRVERERAEASSGTVIAEDLVVTSLHALRHADDVTIVDGRGEARAGQLVGADAGTDLALFRVAGGGLTPPQFAAHDALRVGHFAVALGRPGTAIRASLRIIGLLSDALQTPQGGRLERYIVQLIVVDFRGTEKINAFNDRVGINGDYAQHVLSGNILDCGLWATLDQRCDLGQKAPLIVVGSDDDMVNLEAALWLRRRYSDAFVVARSFMRSPFSTQIADECNIVLFAIADLVSEAIPMEWCAPS